MAFGSSSAMFRAWVQNNLLKDPGGSTPTGYTNIEADTLKVALFNNSVTPDKDAAVGSTGYNTGTWTTGNEVSDTNWAAGGRVLDDSSLGYATGTALVTYDAADLSGGGNVTLTNAYGCLVYDDTITAGTVADQGMTFHSFGGAQSVTAGTFTIVWHANGLFQMLV